MLCLFAGQTTNFRGIRSNLGTIDDLKLFIEAAESKGKHVILELDPNHSSLEHKWFKESVARNGNYSDYYIWASPKGENGGKSPPNNWVLFLCFKYFTKYGIFFKI